MTTWHAPDSQAFDLRRGIKLAAAAYASRTKREPVSMVQARFESPDDDGIVVLLTVQDVAALLKCSVSSLNKWRLRQTGPPFVRVGSRVRYRLADVQAYIANQTRTST